MGDRVIMLKDYGEEATEGEEGVVIEILKHAFGSLYFIEFDNYNPHRHNYMGFAKEGHGCYIDNPIERGFVGYNIPKLHEPYTVS